MKRAAPLRAVVAAALAINMVAANLGPVSVSARPVPQTKVVVGALGVPPVRVQVKEPPRVRPSTPPASAIRPQVVRAIRPVNGIRVAGPPMFLPHEINAVLKAAARRPASVRTITLPTAGSVRRAGVPSVVAPAATRRPQSLPSDSSASGTGINPWWLYQEQGVLGGGRVMVNVGTGNLLLQDDDMTVSHKGIAMAFRRTYNSQVPSVVSGFFANSRSLYGNGWTNTFDAHISYTPD